MTRQDTPSSSCCAPAKPVTAALSPAPIRRMRGAADFETVAIPGGTALVGTRHPGIPDDGEGPIRHVRLRPFRMGATTVTTSEFAAFVAETGFVTDAERFGWSFVFWSDVPAGIGPTKGVQSLEWWRRVDGATWKAPFGPGTEAAPDHPVVHVSWNDARAMAAWAGAALPTEAQWEHAARAGQGDVKFPWGDAEPDDSALFPCNIWQGRFPDRNTGADGYTGTAPARSFEPNAFGLYNMVGNVWEWTAEPFRIRSLKKRARAREDGMKGFMLLKGGSHLCHRSYCYRYRIAARSGNSPDSTTTHQGLRLVWTD